MKNSNYQSTYRIDVYQTNRDTYVVGIRVIRDKKSQTEFLNEIKRIKRFLKKDTGIK